MPSSDYTTTGGGLKLKGARGAGIDKKKKKSRKASKAVEEELDDVDTKSPARADGQAEGEIAAHTLPEGTRRLDGGKTETERRHEEMRRKRLDERLKKEGVKTHKERVEELNKYLSGLSEHHDMPRIGPG